jgi:hypothetical protein
MAIVERDGMFVRNVTQAYRWMVTHKAHIHHITVKLYERDERRERGGACLLEVVLDDPGATTMRENWGMAEIAYNLALRYSTRVKVIDNAHGDWRLITEDAIKAQQEIARNTAQRGKHNMTDWTELENTSLQAHCTDCQRVWTIVPRMKRGVGAHVAYSTHIEGGQYRCAKTRVRKVY